MTKLANDRQLSLVDAAKFLGVQVRTLMVYHRKDKEKVGFERNFPAKFSKKFSMKFTLIFQMKISLKKCCSFCFS